MMDSLKDLVSKYTSTIVTRSGRQEIIVNKVLYLAFKHITKELSMRGSGGHDKGTSLHTVRPVIQEPAVSVFYVRHS
jgi:hypothetical protein